MIVEVRSYRIKPGRREEFIEFFRITLNTSAPFTRDESTGTLT